MMDDMEILSQMLKGTILVEMDRSSNNGRVNLSDRQTPGVVVAVKGLPSDALIIKADEFKSPDTVFNGCNGECKRADYVIISSEKKRIIYIEMKQTKKEEWHIVQQLTGAQCFIAYCREIGRRFWKENKFLEEYKDCFVSIKHIRLSKKPTRVDPTGAHDTPDKAMKIAWPKVLYFSELAGL